MEALDRILDGFTSPTTGSLHGAAFIAVNKHGEIIYQKAAGRASASIDNVEPLELNSSYWIASMTKLVTAVAAVQLVERGILSLDEEVRDKIPELRHLQVLQSMEQGPGGPLEPKLQPVKGKITLRHMLTHAAGFVYDSSSPVLQEWSRFRGRTAHTFTGSMDGYRHPLVFQPGTSWGYGAGLDWAGQLIEYVTSATLEEYMQANIWSKIGASSTTFHPELHAHTVPPQMEMGRRMSVGQGAKSIKPGRVILGYPLKDDLGGIGLFSTPRDFVKLLSALLQGGGPLLRSESVDLLFRPQLSDVSRVAMAKLLGKQMRRVLGVADGDDFEQADHSPAGAVTLKDIPGRRRRGTASWSGLPNLHWWIDREAGIAAALFTQIMPPADAAVTDLVLKLEEALYDVLNGPSQSHAGPKL
ncbi:beta-lactamase/transpeptidase-like protein [Aspergillus pseudoustus]|uniref:Beta-lactamase/transpeptidase-like protein n=1 Tax=Aspergillus pseudoustus TaxID=1810923 RepID=A0ABR4JES3_9EURO